MKNNGITHKIWWLWVPVLGLLIQGGLEIFCSSRTLAVLHAENGSHELLQAVLLVIAFGVAVLLLMDKNVRKTPWLLVWVGLAATGCFYVAGEEISWGQHFLNWSTPEYWSALNDQGETNLHNTSSWLDQKPRLVLEIGVITGGLIIPLLLKFKPHLLPQRFALIYPASVFSVTAGLFLTLKIVDKIEGFTDLEIFTRVSEVEELYLFYFVLIYLLMLRKRIKLHYAP